MNGNGGLYILRTKYHGEKGKKRSQIKPVRIQKGLLGNYIVKHPDNRTTTITKFWKEKLYRKL